MCETMSKQFYCIDRLVRDIKVKLPTTFDELEKIDSGHTLECFHNLDIDIINVGTKALHHSVHLFMRKLL